MKHRFVRAALVSPEVRLGAVEQNKDSILKAIFALNERSPEIILSSRLSLSGYSCGSLFVHQTLLQGCIDALISFLEQTKNVNSLIVIGMPFKMANKIYDCSVVTLRGKVVAFVPQNSTNPIFSSFPNDQISYVKIDAYEVPFTKNITFYNSALDYSIKFWDAPAHLPSTEIILRPLAATKTVGSLLKELNYSQSFSIEKSCALLSCSAPQAECNEQIIYDNFRMVSELGTSVGLNDRANPDITLAEIDVGGISYHNSTKDLVPNAHLNSCISKTAKENINIDFAINNNDSGFYREIERHPLAPHSRQECEEIIDILSQSIRAKMLEVGHEKIIFGLSGGLDSALVLMLCNNLFQKLNLPKQNILAVTMPSSHTSTRTAQNAKKLILNLGVTGIDIPIGDAVEKHLKDISHTQMDVVYENAQARERAQILLDLSNKHGALLLGTSDLSELCLGFGTYGGDLTAHFNTNGWLTKTAIRYIIKYFADTSTDNYITMILGDILDTPVSPELLENQNTEAILGAYEVHDFIIYSLIAKGYDVEKTLFLAELAFKDRPKKELFTTLDTFVNRFFRFRFKQNFCCDSPIVIEENLAHLVSNILGGLSIELWQKELKNIKI